MKPLQVFLGILTACGGFVDIGELVFAAQGGSQFGYKLLWPVAVGALGIIVYAEMCGRIAAVAKKPVFSSIRETVGLGTGLVTLAASQLLNILTCAAEVGGVAIALRLLLDAPYGAMVLAAIAVLIVCLWVLSFDWIERLFGCGGLFMLVFLGAAVWLGPDWGETGKGLLPQVPDVGGKDLILYAYFAVGIIGSTIMPYEVHFYSSGGIEEHWEPEDIPLNKYTSIIGFTFGALITMSIIVIGADLFLSEGIKPELLGTSLLGPVDAFGKVGLVFGLIGITFAVGGAAVETSLGGAYNFSQFFGWEWGRYRNASGAPRFTLAWLLIFILAAAILFTGVNPVLLTEYAVIFSVVALPLTYFPILAVAGNSDYMGEYKNGPLATALGWVYLLIILVLAVAAVPLLVLSNGGQG